MGLVNQRITVKFPPSRDYVMRATMPIPRNVDLTQVGNSAKAPQQYRFFGRTKNWDLYEWMVYVRGGTTEVLISDDYAPRKKLKPASIETGPVTPQQPIELPFTQVLASINDPTAFALRFERADGYTETVPISGEYTKSIRRGSLKVTRMKHIRTVDFGNLHVIWDVTLNDPYIRLTLNWHTGIPGKPEVLCKSVKLIRPNGARWVPELNDPAMDETQDYILTPAPNSNHFMPRMAQRSFRLLLFLAISGPPADTQDVGWGVADWSQGGFLPAELKAHPLTYVTNLEQNVVSAAATENGNLGTNTNSWEGVSQPSSGHVLWPVIGQQYGGPTGSDSKYKAYNGIRTLASNRREGLLYHKVLQLRNHSRHWVAIYEEDGEPVVPEFHLDTNGNAQWKLFIGNGAVWEEDNPTGSFVDPYGLWKDEGFNFDAHRERRVPREAPELQTSGGGVLPPNQRWDCWDQQHQMLTWQDDLALAYLDADPLAILYLIQIAETMRMAYWTGPGAAGGRLVIAPAAGQGQAWGRDMHWSMYAIACASVFAAAEPNVNSNTGEPVEDTRRARWVNSQLRVYIQSTEKAMMPNGCAWCYGGPEFGKVFSDPPINSSYWVNQVFEIAYGMNALAACAGVFGDFWPSIVLGGGAPVDVLGLVGAFARCLDTFHWATSTAVATFPVPAAGDEGAGYQVGDILTLMSDHYIFGSGTPPSPAVEAQARVATVNGSGGVTSMTVQVAGAYYNQPGAPARMFVAVTAPVISAQGTGYVVGQTLSPAGGVQVQSNSNLRAIFRVNTVNPATGAITSLTQVQVGRYLTPPPTPSALVYASGTTGAGAGATATFTRSGSGSGLRVSPTWAAPVEAGSGPLKYVPFGPYPTTTRYTTRADIVPLDTANHTSLKDSAKNTSYGISVAGAGYTLNDIVTVVGGTTSLPARFQIVGINAGVPTVLSLVDPGSYTVVPPSSPRPTTGGTGTGLTINVNWSFLSGIGSAEGHFISTPGAGYTLNDIVSLVGGSRNHASPIATTFQITAVQAGVPTAIRLVGNGLYTVAPRNPCSVTGGSGAGLKIDVDWEPGAGQQTIVRDSITAILGLFGLAGAPEAQALFLQYTGAATIAGAVTAIKNRGQGGAPGIPGGSSGAEQIENYWPVLGFFDMP